MTTDTALPFDSVTKTAVAAHAMRLVEEGRLRLDDPIARWYPRWRGDPDATVRDLLGHTSGLGDPSDELFLAVLRHPRRLYTPRDYLAATPKPGPRTDDAVYSNAGYIMLGLILARAGEEDVTTALRREVLGDGLAFQPREHAHEPHAHSYGLGVAKAGVDDHVLWGHTGDGLGSHTELWHLPKEELTVAVSWNDDVIDRDGQILPELVRAA
jgi:D-alanyl-D-alanine carboxypeptidase